MNKILKFHEDYVRPFDNLEQLFQALFVYSKLEHHEKNDIIIIQVVIFEITGILLSHDNLKFWIDKINFHTNLYPKNLFDDMDNLNNRVNLIINKKKVASIAFKTNLKNCVICKFNFNLMKKT
jgi:hypothetical protein